MNQLLPRTLDGVTILAGVELSIIDYEGSVDLPEQILQKLEWVIASHHISCLVPADIKSHTRNWI